MNLFMTLTPGEDRDEEHFAAVSGVVTRSDSAHVTNVNRLPGECPGATVEGARAAESSPFQNVAAAAIP
jgi:hypothetical protein